ncbi:hypothetical protein [Dyella acidiphila]|uniref:Transposase n=1 Tax=Dyella acidiphila TaxID=2775866 RepID=A0ABR9GDB0_9GAMM|nr:hypothetical protein [Dyella acidiphila]MBE1162034.1 hypothetical protein [Dyella acidiphila]
MKSEAVRVFVMTNLRANCVPARVFKGIAANAQTLRRSLADRCHHGKTHLHRIRLAPAFHPGHTGPRSGLPPQRPHRALVATHPEF